MDYEKKYRKALERAKRLHSEPTGGTERIVCEQIFPELKESEDEKIRKALLNTVKYYHFKESPYMFGISKEQTIAWLEKQGEQKLNGTFVNVDDVREDFIDEVYRVLDADPTNDRANQIIDAFDNLPTVTIEKQSEHKPQSKSAVETIKEEKVDNSNRVEPKDYNSIDPHFAKPADKVEPKFEIGDTIINIHHRCDGNSRIREIKDGKYIFDDGSYIVIKEQDSWELVDKNKPKFKVGDWIVWQGKYFKVNYNGCGYELTSQNGESTSLEYRTIDENAHIWDIIKDAKEGDVLYSPKGAGVECIFLIKGWKQDEYAGKTLCSYIGYRVEEDEIVVSEPGAIGAIWWEGVMDPFYPATKEQRDTLMKAMADAGYTFDFDKKKLKKIDMKSVDSVSNGLRTASIKHAEKEILNPTFPDNKEFELAYTFEEGAKWDAAQKPTAWGKEDEYWSERLLGWLNTLINYIHYDSMVSLDLRRDRIQQVEQIKTWLKSLKQRYTWKPSDEQMDALVYHLKHTNENSRLYKETKKLYDQLKKLK